jgi:hypothetical protein
VLQGRHFETGEELLGAILDLLRTIQKVTVARVFLEWMERLAKCISTNDEYVGGDESKNRDWGCFIRWESRYSSFAEQRI